MDAPFSFNRSIRIGSRRDRITGDSGALTGRELLRRSRVVRFLAKRLPDKREPIVGVGNLCFSTLAGIGVTRWVGLGAGRGNSAG